MAKGGFKFRQHTMNWDNPAEYTADFRQSDLKAVKCVLCDRFRTCGSGSCRGWCDGVRRVERLDGWSPPWCPRKVHP